MREREGLKFSYNVESANEAHLIKQCIAFNIHNWELPHSMASKLHGNLVDHLNEDKERFRSFEMASCVKMREWAHLI